MRENQHVVSKLETQLGNRAYYNIHGSKFSTDGTPDILMVGKNGEFIGVECKISGKQIPINQIRQGLNILKSGGRFIIALEDISLNNIDNKSLNIIEFDKDITEWDDEIILIKYFESSEWIIKD